MTIVTLVIRDWRIWQRVNLRTTCPKPFGTYAHQRAGYAFSDVKFLILPQSCLKLSCQVLFWMCTKFLHPPLHLGHAGYGNSGEMKKGDLLGHYKWSLLSEWSLGCFWPMPAYGLPDSCEVLCLFQVPASKSSLCVTQCSKRFPSPVLVLDNSPRCTESFWACLVFWYRHILSSLRIQRCTLTYISMGKQNVFTS